MFQLGEDEHGIWLGARQGATLQRGAEREQAAPWDFVQLIRPGSWWTLIASDPRRLRLYVDIITPAVWQSPDLVTMVDLDLDVVLETGGDVYVDDEDEFEAHREALGYPRRWVERAPAVAADVVGRLQRREAPFNVVAERWLGRVAGS